VVNQRWLAGGAGALPVMDGERLLGLLRVQDVKRVPRLRWPLLDAGALMTPWRQVLSVAPEESAADAFDRLSASGADELPVVVGGRLTGMIRSADIARWLELAGASPTLRERRV